jgi:hypothetical protein
MGNMGLLDSPEFKNLLVLHHKLVERVATIEADVQHIKRDHLDLKALVGRRLR